MDLGNLQDEAIQAQAQEIQKDLNGQEYDVSPQPESRFKVTYPEQAKAEKIEGMVILQVTIDISGHISKLSVKKSSGHKELDRSAEDSVRVVTWQPAKLQDEPVEVTIAVPVRFKLK